MRLAGITFFRANDNIELTSGKHTFFDWKLGLTDPAIPEPPEPNEIIVDIEGGNGFVDLSRALTGEMTYKNRDGKFSFLYLGERNDFARIYSEISSYVHGQNLKFITDEDPDYYYVGNFTLEKFSVNKSKIKFSISYNLQPFKYSIAMTSTTVAYDSLSTENTQQVEAIDSGRPYAYIPNTILTFAGGIIDITNCLTLQVRFPLDMAKNAQDLMTVRFYDSEGNDDAVTVTKQNIIEYQYWDGTWGSLELTASDISSLNVSGQKVNRVFISGWGNCTLWMKYAGTVVTISGCDCAVSPIITVPNENFTVVCNGVSYSIGNNYSGHVDGLTIPKEGATLSFGAAGQVTGNITVEYQGKWL